MSGWVGGCTQTHTPSHHLEPPQLLGVGVGVGAIRHEAGVVAVDYVINAVPREELVQELGGEVVGHAWGGG